MSHLSPQPIPGLSVKPPTMTPQPGQVIIGYERFKYPADCCDCNGLSEGAYIAMLVLFFLGIAFLPIWFFIPVPLCMDDCRKDFQRPVYGFPGQGMAQPQMGVAQVGMVQMQPQQQQQGYPPQTYVAEPQYPPATAPPKY
eukprot:TRINITY_DN44971_c0_g1_i11.p3 TRINITY_DN44971_c0_g1~~TRINITY_DN44971_c0_g1_i11.p3  ORF type:complete len:160 (-),score=11.21 TRINITY_DN44971_c0_g1_i11:1017-1436(-)